VLHCPRHLPIALPPGHQRPHLYRFSPRQDGFLAAEVDIIRRFLSLRADEELRMDFTDLATQWPADAPRCRRGVA
jgi:hypothetical protein